MRQAFFAVLCVAILTGCGSQLAVPQAEQANTQQLKIIDLDPVPAAPAKAASGLDEFTLGTGYRVQNLTVIPLCFKTQAKDVPDFITLDEALRAKTVTAREINQGHSAVVGRIVVENKSNQPLFLMPGEVLLGGRQDRTIAAATVIPPHSKPTEVEVYCVEQQRWNRREQSESAALLRALADARDKLPADEIRELAKSADEGYFIATAGTLSRSARKVVARRRGQNRVWNEVGEINVRNQAESRAGSFVANFADPEVARQVESFVTTFRDKITQEKCAVGVLVAVNGKPVAADIFATPALFQKFWPKLLQGYALDAVVNDSSENPNPPCTKEAINVFLSKIRASQGGDVTTRGGLSVTTHNAIGEFESQSSTYEGKTIMKGNFE